MTFMLATQIFHTTLYPTMMHHHISLQKDEQFRRYHLDKQLKF